MTIPFTSTDFFLDCIAPSEFHVDPDNQEKETEMKKSLFVICLAIALATKGDSRQASVLQAIYERIKIG